MEFAYEPEEYLQPTSLTFNESQFYLHKSLKQSPNANRKGGKHAATPGESAKSPRGN